MFLVHVCCLGFRSESFVFVNCIKMLIMMETKVMDLRLKHSKLVSFFTQFWSWQTYFMVRIGNSFDGGNVILL